MSRACIALLAVCLLLAACQGASGTGAADPGYAPPPPDAGGDPSSVGGGSSTVPPRGAPEPEPAPDADKPYASAGLVATLDITGIELYDRDGAIQAASNCPRRAHA